MGPSIPNQVGTMAVDSFREIDGSHDFQPGPILHWALLVHGRYEPKTFAPGVESKRQRLHSGGT